MAQIVQKIPHDVQKIRRPDLSNFLSKQSIEYEIFKFLRKSFMEPATFDKTAIHTLAVHVRYILKRT